MSCRVDRLCVVASLVLGCSYEDAPNRVDDPGQGGASSLGDAAAEPEVFADGYFPDIIVLPDGITAAQCRAPSQMPTSVPEAVDERPCRRMKWVQTYLNHIIDPRRRLANGGDLDGNETADELRRKRFFGRGWARTFEPFETVDPEQSSGLRPRRFIPRMLAVLIASTHPVDRRDQEIDRFPDMVDETNWWWELPRAYADIVVVVNGEPDFDETMTARAEQMREDVVEWLLNEGTPKMFAYPGARDDYDFDLMHVLALLYLTHDHAELLDTENNGGGDQSINVWDALVRQGWDPDDPPYDGAADDSQHHRDDEWENGPVPMSGSYDFDEVFDSEKPLAALVESENHVLTQLAYHYLINQWVHDGLGNKDVSDYVFDDVEGQGEDFYKNDGSLLEDKLLDVLSRPLFNGMWETNGRPYNGISLTPMLLLEQHLPDGNPVKVAAQNALAYNATKFAFQELDGRRWTPSRRKCGAAWENSLYGEDPVARQLGAIGGAYKWNDSPYGFRDVIAQLQAKADDADMTFREFLSQCPQNENACAVECDNADGCHWRHFSWKSMWLLDGEADHDDKKKRFEYRDGAGSPADKDLWRTVSSLSGGQTNGFLAALSDYEIPPAVHEFMLSKHDGYYARMMAHYQASHYDLFVVGNHNVFSAEYFDEDKVPYEVAGGQYERTPEFYFAGRNFINASGGLYNTHKPENESVTQYLPNPAPFGDQVVCSQEETWNAYVETDYDRQDSHGKVGEYRRIQLGEFDFASRPSAILTQVPVRTFDDSSFSHYEPYGLGHFPIEEARNSIPLMPGRQRVPWRSAHVGTYKSFTYGYRFDCDLDFCSNLEDSDAALLPEEWLDELDNTDVATLDVNPKTQITVYDFREALQNLYGIEGFFLAVGRTRKVLSLREHARGFWEVIPDNGTFASAGEVRDHLHALNKAGDFNRFAPFKNDTYTMGTTGESLELRPLYGLAIDESEVLVLLELLPVPNFVKVALLLAITRWDVSVQGIHRLYDAQGDWLDREIYFTKLWSPEVMNAVPLIDVKAVDDHFDYRLAEVEEDGETQIVPVYYACARDGWMCVNNVFKVGATDEFAATYLWVDARPTNGQWAPTWQYGSFSDPEEVWCGCFGPNPPGPPDSAVDPECSPGNPDPKCEEDDGGGDGGGSGDGGPGGTGTTGGATTGGGTGTTTGGGSGPGDGGPGDGGPVDGGDLCFPGTPCTDNADCNGGLCNAATESCDC